MTSGEPLPLLVGEDLSVAPPGEDAFVHVLDGVSLALQAGEVVDLVGPSGSGKSTLLRTLARLMPHAGGVLSLAGVCAAEIPPSEWRRRVTLLPQKASVAAATIGEELRLPYSFRVRKGMQPPSDDALRSALAAASLASLALDRDTARLSVGQQARIALVRTLLAKPDVLLLDEPDAALDDDSAAAVRALIARFAHDGGAVLRARHGATDGLASRTLRIESGHLTEEAR